MATSGSATDPYSGRTAFNGYLVVSRSTVSGQSARWAWSLYARNPSGSSASYNLGNNPWSVNVEGVSFSGTHSLDFRGGQASILLGSGLTGFISQGSGTRVINFSFSHGPAGIFGTAAASGSFTANALVTVPGAPPAPVFLSATARSLTFRIAQPSNNGGSPVLSYTMAVYLPVSMGGALVESWVSGSSNQTSPSTLQPGISYRVAYRARNAIGLGPWSALVNMTTLAVSAPGMTVTPSSGGNSATVVLTPPANFPTPNGYRIERRVAGTTTPVTTRDTTTPSTAISGLVPGVTYEWRAAALAGTTPGVYTAWLPVAQPAPNLNPGDFFDGNSPPRTDVTYSWTGTTNNSISVGMAVGPLGWGIFESGSAVSGGSGAVAHATGGRSGDFCARVIFHGGTSAAGFHAGLDTVAPGVALSSSGTSHAALLHVQLPSRSQRLAAMLLWVDGAGVEVGRTVGESIIVPGGAAAWAPLTVSGVAPLGTEGVAVRVIDVAGSGWSPWVSGDVMLMDDAITPFGGYYFDGDTLDSAEFTYDWEGTPNQSPSIRTENPIDPAPPLLDPDCPPVPAPPRPPFIDDSCVEEDVIEWRRISANIESWRVPQWGDIVPTLSLTAIEDVRLVRIRYYPNPFSRPLGELEPDTYCSEQIITFIPGGAILTLDGITERVWGEVAGSSDLLAADHLLASQRGDTPLWPALSCGSPYYLTVDVPSDLPEGAVAAEYELTPRYS